MKDDVGELKRKVKSHDETLTDHHNDIFESIY
jgi:hypothetical protein